MCNARQYSDQMLCSCGLAWDTNDEDPPICPEDGKPAPMSGAGRAVGMPEEVRAQIDNLIKEA